MSRQDFGRRLQRLLDERHWSQSDLIRKVLEVTGQRMGRDAISTYVNGRSLPNARSLNLLSKALGMSSEELLQHGLGQEVSEAVELRPAPDHPGKTWLRVERLLSFDTAAKIVQLINAEDEKRSA